MKKFVLILLICLLLYGVTQPVTAQGPVIYLPIIVKEGDCNMTTWAVLEISDGTPGGTVNLLSGGATGFHLKDWNPQIIQPKEGGVFQDSPIAPGRRLVYAVDATAIETMTIDVNDYDEDSLIEQAQDLMRLLNKARAYGGTTDYQDTPVYLRARSDCETNDRYAVIINWAIPELDNPYAPPFVVAGEIALMDDLTLQLERGHWTANAPGTAEEITATNSQEWDMTTGWTLYDSLGALPSLPSPSSQYLPLAIGNSTVIVFPNDVAGVDDIYYSTDNAATWTASIGGSNVIIYDVLKIADNYVIASEVSNGGRILLTTDQGANFSVLSGDPNLAGGPLVRLSNGNLLTTDGVNDVYVSTDSGVNWSNIGSVGWGTVSSFSISSITGTIIAKTSSGYNTRLYRSTDGGVTWTLVFGGTASYSLSQGITSDSAGFFYALIGINGFGMAIKSTDDGISWDIIYDIPLPGGVEYSIFSDGEAVYIGSDSGGAGNVKIYKSIYGGASFSEVFSGGGEFVPIGFSTGSSGGIWVGGAALGGGNGGLIYYIVDSDSFGSTTANKLYVTNKHNIAQLSHIYIDDGGVFGANLFPVAAAFDMFPAVPAVNDAIYFGCQSSLVNSGPFGGLRLYIVTPVTVTVSYAIIPEYWTGAAWATLTVQDNTNSISQVGYNSIHWSQPSNWATTAVNGVTAYWVRLRVSAITGVMTPPTHGDDDIFAFNIAFVEINSSEIGGDISAIAQIKAINQSDRDGPGGSAPNLYDNRLIIGLRTLDRGDTFQAYLNVSDEQNPDGVTVSLGTNTTFAADATAPTGRRATYNPGGVEAMATRATIALGPTIARDFYGTYHAFLRAQRTAGVSTNLTVRLQVATGSGGITYTITSQQLQTTTAFEVLDFGEITLPVSSSFKSTDLADTTEIRIQASAASGTPDLNLYDLILIPVDEWAVDAVDMANESDSDTGRSNGISKLLDIDSITFPKEDIRTLVKTTGSEFVTAEYTPITGGGGYFTR